MLSAAYVFITGILCACKPCHAYLVLILFWVTRYRLFLLFFIDLFHCLSTLLRMNKWSYLYYSLFDNKEMRLHDFTNDINPYLACRLVARIFSKGFLSLYSLVLGSICLGTLEQYPKSNGALLHLLIPMVKLFLMKVGIAP